MYVRCVGQIKEFGGQRAVNAFKIMPLTDHNAITAHLMDIVHIHLVHTRGNKDVRFLPCCISSVNVLSFFMYFCCLAGNAADARQLYAADGARHAHGRW